MYKRNRIEDKSLFFYKNKYRHTFTYLLCFDALSNSFEPRYVRTKRRNIAIT